MKKAFLLAFFLLPLSLCSCTLRLGDGASIEVAPWAVVLIVLLALAVIFLIMYCLSPKELWGVCSQCNTRFFVEHRVFPLASHSPRESFGFVAKCPHCKKRRLCYKSYEQER